MAASHGYAAAGDTDTSFVSIPLNPGGPMAIGLAPNGKIFVGGSFTNVGGVSHGSIARLHADGTHDQSFTLPTGEPGIFFFQAALTIGTFVIPEVKRQGTVNSLAIQSSGRPVIIGDFNRVRSATRAGIARLNLDGSHDTGFDPGSGPDDAVYTVLALPDDRLLVGGKFKKWNGISRGGGTDIHGIVRLLQDGAIDTSFGVPSGVGIASYGALAAASDGKYYALTAIAQFPPKSKLLRLNSDGSRDASFPLLDIALGASNLSLDPGGGGAVGQTTVTRFGPDGVIDAAFSTRMGSGSFGPGVFLGDGRFIVLDHFKGPRRYQADGTPDPSFVPKQISPIPPRMLLQPDGRLLVANMSFFPPIAHSLVRLLGDPQGPPLITIEPTNQKVTEGAAAFFSVSVTGNGPFQYQWQRDGQDIAGVTERVLTIPAASTPASYRVKISNASGTATSTVAALEIVPPTPGTPYLESTVHQGANARISVILPVGNGKLIAAGSFGAVDGIPRNRIVRMNDDASVDSAFDTSSNAGINIFNVSAAAAQSNGSILLVGNLSATYGSKQHHIIRYLPTGALDTTFASAATAVLGANDMLSLVALPDDRILIGGLFSSLLDNTPAAGLFCLNPDGTLNTAFNSGGSGFNRSAGVQALQLHTDGAVIVAVNTSAGLTYNSTPVKAIVRLLPDGKLDSNFNNQVPANVSANFLLVQRDGKILCSGGLDRLNPSPLGFNAALLRLNPDGSLDTTFDTSGIGPSDTQVGTAWCFAIQPDNRILIGGSISIGGAPARPAVFRLDPNGRFDSTFQIGFSGPLDATPILGVGLLRPGALLAAGEFRQFAGVSRTNMIRLNSGPFDYAAATPPSIVDQSPVQTLTEDETATFSITASGTPPFRYQWYSDHGPIDQATNSTFTLSNLTVAHSGRYYCAVVNAGGTNLSNPNRSVLLVNPLNPAPGTNDESAFLARSFAISRVDGFLPLENSRLLVGGEFRPKTNSSVVFSVLRLNPDWSLDTDFTPATATSTSLQPLVPAMARSTDGFFLIGGQFSSVNGVQRQGLARLSPDGSLDLNFNPAPGNLERIIAQPDGKLLILSTVGPTGATLHRLHSNGALDTSFSLPSEIDPRQVHVLPDGSLLVSGQRFIRDAAGTLLRADNYAARFLQNGSPDVAWTPTATIATLFPNGNDRFLASGLNLLGSPQGADTRQIVRLNSNGMLDSSFVPVQVRLANSFQYLLHSVPLPDGKTLVAAYFDSIGTPAATHTTWHLARLNSDGSPDRTFKTYFQAPDHLSAIAQLDLDSSGRILVLQNGGLSRLFNTPGVSIPAGFRISHPVVSVNMISIPIETLPGKVYLLEFKATLDSPVWSPVATAQGDGSTKTLAHEFVPSVSGFYRIRVE